MNQTDKTLIDPLKRDASLKYCSACDNSSATFSGKFVTIPPQPETKRDWLSRLGLLVSGEPMPRARSFYVCEDHFDKEQDFRMTAKGLRVRSGILPWKNLRTGTHSYHGLELLSEDIEVPKLCLCKCCASQPRPPVQSRRTTSTQTGDDGLLDSQVPTEAKQVPRCRPICRFCFEKKDLTSLFCENRPVNPELMSKIYTATGILLNGTNDGDACICASCCSQVEQSCQFRLKTTRNNQAFTVSTLFEPEHILINAEAPEQIVVKLEPGQLLFKDECSTDNNVKVEPPVGSSSFTSVKVDQSEAFGLKRSIRQDSLILPENAAAGMNRSNKYAELKKFQRVMAKVKRSKQS